MNAGTYLQKVISTLKTDSPEHDAQILLAHVIGHPRTWLLAHLDSPLSTPVVDLANQAFAKLEAGEPLPYILGHWEFYGMDFDITPDVLIPRPETELLVEIAIKWLTANPSKRSVADIGTGSGVIATSIASHIPDATILATDISSAALQVAKRNAQKLNVQGHIVYVECDLLPVQLSVANRKLQLDLLCANLPYIPTQTLIGLPIFGCEPTIALDGGEDGLDLVRRLMDVAPEWLAPDGTILLEIEARQGSATLNLAVEKFPGAHVTLHQDLAGHDRLVQVSLK